MFTQWQQYEVADTVLRTTHDALAKLNSIMKFKLKRKNSKKINSTGCEIEEGTNADIIVSLA